MKKQENQLVIKKVDADTFDEFAVLVDKLAKYEKLSPPDEAAKKRLKVDCLSEKPRYEAFVGKIRGKCVSYALCFFTYSSFLALPTLFLEDIFVLEEHRGQGIGKKMFGEIREIAKRQGCCRIEFTVLTWNKSAQQFYERNKAERSEWFLYRLVRENF